MTTDQAIKILNGAIKKPNTIDGYLGQALTMAIEALKNEPVRCEDCTWWDTESKEKYRVCYNNTSSWKADDFCSYGKLKGNEE